MAIRLGIIPARGGSKGVKRKNVRLLNGKPLIAYAIEAALKSQLITDVIVTTDDSEAKKIAEEYGVSVIDRPGELASDTAKMVDVVTHAIQSFSPTYTDDDIFCLLQPTCPFREASDIDESIILINQYQTDAVVAVHEALHTHPERFYHFNNERIEPLMPEYSGLNRQELPKFYIRNGVIYTLNINKFLDSKLFSPKNSYPLVVPEIKAVNIDEEQDFLYAQFCIEAGIVHV